MKNKTERYWQFFVKNEYGKEGISLEAYIHRIFGMKFGGRIVGCLRSHYGYSG